MIIEPEIDPKPCMRLVWWNRKARCKRPFGHTGRCEPKPREGEHTVPSYSEMYQWRLRLLRVRNKPWLRNYAPDLDRVLASGRTRR